MSLLHACRHARATPCRAAVRVRAATWWHRPLRRSMTATMRRVPGVRQLRRHFFLLVASRRGVCVGASCATRLSVSEYLRARGRTTNCKCARACTSKHAVHVNERQTKNLNSTTDRKPLSAIKTRLPSATSSDAIYLRKLPLVPLLLNQRCLAGGTDQSSFCQ